MPSPKESPQRVAVQRPCQEPLPLNSQLEALDTSIQTPIKAGTHFTDPEGMEGWVDPLLSLSFEPATTVISRLSRLFGRVVLQSRFTQTDRFRFPSPQKDEDILHGHLLTCKSRLPTEKKNKSVAHPKRFASPSTSTWVRKEFDTSPLVLLPILELLSTPQKPPHHVDGRQGPHSRGAEP